MNYTRIKKSLQIGAASLLLATPLFVTANEEKPALDYKDGLEFIKDFLDLSKKPNQPLKYWAMQLLMLTQKEAQLSQFRTDIAEAVRHRNARRISLAFLINKDKFPLAMQNYIKHFKGLSEREALSEVNSIIQQRVKK